MVLDEPTSGLDPFSRRAVWELLRSMKQGRVTVGTLRAWFVTARGSLKETSDRCCLHITWTRPGSHAMFDGRVD